MENLSSIPNEKLNETHKKVTTIAQKVTSVILTPRVLILTRSIRVPVARASKEMVLIARVSLHIF